MARGADLRHRQEGINATRRRGVQSAKSTLGGRADLGRANLGRANLGRDRAGELGFLDLR